jgi:negative regulator of sigma E activity
MKLAASGDPHWRRPRRHAATMVLHCMLFAAVSTMAIQHDVHAQSEAPADKSAVELDAEQAQQREQVMQWLERMALAVEQLNYQGSFVYQQGEAVRLLRIEHHRDHRGVRERLYAYENRQLEILRNNNLVQASSPANQTDPILNYSQFTRLPASHLLRDSSDYHFELGAEQEVAGYLAQHIAILPRDSLRYGFEYWLEVRTGMLLKQELLNSDGDVLEMLLFTDIEMGQPRDGQVLAGPVLQSRQRKPSPGLLADSASTADDRGLRRQQDNDNSNADEALLQSSGSELVDDLTGLPQAGGWSEADQNELADTYDATDASTPARGRPAWQCVNPPRGYSLVAHQQSSQRSGAFLDHLLYSDGLSQISVYIERNQPAADRGASADNELPASRLGVMNVYRRQLDNVSITALGAAPYRTLRMLGGSMVRLSAASNDQAQANQTQANQTQANQTRANQ